MIIKIKDFIESKIATSGEKGFKLQEVIRKNLDDKIILDFQDIDLVNSAFLRRAIGELYKEKELIPKLDKNLIIKNLDEDDLEILNSRIIPLYKNYAAVEKSQKEFFDEIQD
jgi:anti-anti-sigma regulatory factor